MKFLYRKYSAKKGEVIEVDLQGQVPVKFMTAAEFKKYAGGRTHTYYKGRTDGDIIRIALPFDSIWHAVVEKGNGPATATTKLCPPSAMPELPEYPGANDMNSEEALRGMSLGNRSEG